MASTPEGRVKAAIKRVLAEWGAWYCMPATGGYGKSGVPDFLACQPVVVTADMVGTVMGRFIGIEAKAPGRGSNTSTMQDRELRLIQQAGGLSLVIDDVSVLTQKLAEAGVTTWLAEAGIQKEKPHGTGLQEGSQVPRSAGAGAQPCEAQPGPGGDGEEAGPRSAQQRGRGPQEAAERRRVQLRVQHPRGF